MRPVTDRTKFAFDLYDLDLLRAHFDINDATEKQNFHHGEDQHGLFL